MRRHVPNAITALRLLLLPVLLWTLLAARGTLAWVTLLAIAFSDAADGFFARRWGVQTLFGRVLDPFADKLTQVAALVVLAVVPEGVFTPVPAVFVAIVLSRDLLLAYGAARIHLRRGHVRIRPRFEGKASTALVFALLLAAMLGAPAWVVWTLVALATPLVVAAGIRYALDGLQQGTAEER